MTKKTNITESTRNTWTAASLTDTPAKLNAAPVSCVACDTDALLCCPWCDRPFCADHASFTTACMDCELQAPRSGLLESLALTILTAGFFLGGISALGGYFFWGLIIGLGSFCLAALLALVSRRARWRRSRVDWPLVEGARLEIGADAGEANHRRLGFILARSRREKDMYTAAHNAGFNRVQGCA